MTKSNRIGYAILPRLKAELGQDSQANPDFVKGYQYARKCIQERKESKNLEDISSLSTGGLHEAIQDAHDWPGDQRFNPVDAEYHLGMEAVCRLMDLEEKLEEIRADEANVQRGI